MAEYVKLKVQYWRCHNLVNQTYLSIKTTTPMRKLKEQWATQVHWMEHIGWTTIGWRFGDVVKLRYGAGN